MEIRFYSGLTIAAIALSLLTGCSGGQPTHPDITQPNTASSTAAMPTDQLTQMPSEPLPEAVHDQVMAALSTEIGVPTEQLKLLRYSPATWPDGCLGLGGPDELCTQALVEGWQVEVVDTSTQQSYIYRTNRNGSAVRLSPYWMDTPTQ